MTCRQLVELVTDYLEDRLRDDDRRRFEEHLDVCADCREYVEQVRQTVSGLEGLPEAALFAAITELPLRQREVLVLRDVLGFGAEEASSVLGVTEGNQRVLLHRARSKVRAELERYFADEVAA